ncbi:condensation domain protein [Mycobacterium xenopi 3993]|nr:condensation domain protein [Mycobacterium xenopi 3993]
MLTVPERGSADARDCLHVTDALSDEALIEARSRLDPAAGRMVSALWVSSTRQLVLTIHHLAVDGVSWRILLEDLNIAWAQHRGGQPVALPATGTSFTRWASLLSRYARRPDVVATAEVWRQVAATRRRCPRCALRQTHSPPPDTCRRRWTPTTPACCSAKFRRPSTPGSTTSC